MTEITIETADRFRRAVGDFVRAIQQTEDAPGGQIETLGFLVRGGAQSVAQLARHRRVRHQSMRETVSELEAQGMVVKSPDPADGRGVLVTVTDAGSAVIDVSRVRRSSGIVRAAASALTDDERATLARTAEILDKLRDAIAGV